MKTVQAPDCNMIVQSPLITAVIAFPMAIPRAPNPIRIGATGKSGNGRNCFAVDHEQLIDIRETGESPG